MRRSPPILLVLASMILLGLGLGLGLGLATRLGDLPVSLDPSAAALAQIRAPARSSAGGDPHGSRSARHTIVVDVARQVSPAVVSIGVTKTSYGREYQLFFDDPFFAPYLIRPRRQDFPYLGSGFIIDEAGHVVTNYHVVEGASSITVTLTDRRAFSARLLDADRFVDVALLQIEGLSEREHLPTIALGDSDDIMIGETVLAVGNPFGPLIADPRPSVSVGVVSATSRSFRGDQNGRIYQNMIQTDAAINPGNSGGPLLNLDAEAIGVNTFIFSRSGDSASVGFSIPINRVRRIVEEILEFGRLRAIRMDFETVSLSPPIVQMLDLGVTEGALVRAIDIGGPAERAGLQPKDVITRVDGIDIRDADDLMASFLTRTVGETLDMTVRRDGEELHLKYVIEEGRPPE